MHFHLRGARLEIQHLMEPLAASAGFCVSATKPLSVAQLLSGLRTHPGAGQGGVSQQVTSEEEKHTPKQCLCTQGISAPCSGHIGTGKHPTLRATCDCLSQGHRGGGGPTFLQTGSAPHKKWGQQSLSHKGSAISITVCKRLCGAWTKGSVGCKDRSSHGGNCCYCVLTPEHNSVQLIIFLKLFLAAPDMGKSRNQEQALCRRVFCNNRSTDDGENELEKSDPAWTVLTSGIIFAKARESIYSYVNGDII